MKIVLEIDDDELRRLLVPMLSPRTSQAALSPSRLLTVRDVADQLGISRSKAYELIYRGQIESLLIGRLRRVSPAALAKFIASPAEAVRLPNQPIIRPTSVTPSSRSPSLAAKAPKQRRPKIRPEIDLMPKPVVPGTGPELSDDEWEQIFGQLKEHGWLDDVVEQVRRDRKEGITRTYVLKVSDAARYLGLSRRALDKLVGAGKLRVSTVRSQYRDEKSEPLIPAKDVLALK
jgi:excisionase family DNA binding protein